MLHKQKTVLYAVGDMPAGGSSETGVYVPGVRFPGAISLFSGSSIQTDDRAGTCYYSIYTVFYSVM